MGRISLVMLALALLANCCPMCHCNCDVRCADGKDSGGDFRPIPPQNGPGVTETKLPVVPSRGGR